MKKMLKFYSLFFLMSLFLNTNAHSFCAKCAAIERAREEEQAKTGPKTTPYYDDAFKERISQSYKSDQNEISELESQQTPGAGNSVGNRTAGSDFGQRNNQGKTLSNTEEDENTPRSVPQYQTPSSGARPASLPRTPSSGGSSQAPNEAAGRNNVIYAVINHKDFLKVFNGPFTVFIPSNEALNELPKGTLENLLRTENKERLIELIGNHIVSARIDNLKRNARVKNLNGVDLIIRYENETSTINGAHVLGSEKIGENGVIYIIDNVLIP